jgi:opacity protein-like surface antigen
MKRVTLVAVLFLFVAAIAAAADEAPTAEIFGGYSYVDKICCNLSGWNASAAFNANKYVGVVADFGGAYGTIDDVSVKAHTFLFGPKFSARTEMFTPFAQVLLGVTHVSEKHANSEGIFAMTAGGGLDFNASSKVAVRIAQAEYLLTRSGGEILNNFRYSAGIVIKLGK